MSEFVVVTAFFDIGRENWQRYKRPLNDYLNNFRNLLSLKVNMVIFTEDKFCPFVNSIRSILTSVNTCIIPTQIEDLFMYKYLKKIIEIQNSPSYFLGHPNTNAPEICQPLYNVVTCSKMDLVNKATQLEECKNYSYFFWLDSGYTHNTMDLSKLNWNPTRVFEHKDKMSVVALQSLDVVREDPREFFLQYEDVLIGGFFGGYKEVINKIHKLYYELVEEMLEIGIKDDDQFYNTILAKRHPELFKIFIDNWYGPMRW